MTSKTNLATSVDAIVIGAGFAGIYATYKLRDELGLSVRTFEAGDSVGGTWYWNRYPGARCDSDGFVYCYSFSRKLLEEWQWKGKYPEQPELRAYLDHVADRFDLRRSITFNATVERAVFDEGTSRWIVTTDKGETVSASYLITGIGHLTISKYVPDIQGLKSFRGEWYHTGTWPDDVDLKGKRVGVIGTGSSGVQAIPVIAQEARHLTVFQRTAQYSIPARHETATDEFWADVRAHYDEIWEKAKTSAGGFPWQHNGKRALEVSPEERQAIYESLWAEGGIKFALGSFRDISYDPDANRSVSDFMRDKIREIVKDPEVREKLIPHHPFLSRRPIVDTNYFETYNRDNVTLVDVGENPIVEITPTGLRTTTVDYDLDVMVFATGFDAVTGPFFRVDIRGRDGARLPEKWKAGPRSYLGMQTVDFPNLFMITGPGSTIGNLPLTIETHVDWIADCIAFMRRQGVATIEPTPAAENQWCEHVREQAEQSLMPQTKSWFDGSNIPGKVKAYVFYLGHFGKYRARLKEVADRGMEGFVFDSHSKSERERSRRNA
jgi:cation diffusion facilitator CzcD-associated flavoprotein CzcO